ncbi:hypothetical protein QYE76_000907 [Lolium multiflorum]|uniref:RING-type domain-containing protein n=1 Tax=Lolium multiflorum TaxID=4521 RepID=A0AAD8RLY8_LOLMU|nr:hypothetical protein QYE76_000907 [Lolium multiflorum]
MPGPFAVSLKHVVTPSPVHVKIRQQRTAGGGACSLRLLCSITTSYELQMIGGPGLQVGEEEGHADHVIALHDVDLRSHDACRAAMLKLLSSLPGAGPASLLDPAAGEWYEPVLAAAADGIVSQLQPVTSGEGYAFDVSLCIGESFKYVQPEALLLACEQAEIIPTTSQAPVVERCAVCMERLPLPSPTPTTEEALLSLPSCGHTFHRRCIASWFQKGSTCPLCRRDMMYCLLDAEKRFGLEREDISSKKRNRDMAS